MTKPPSIDQRAAFVASSLEHARVYVTHEAIRRTLGAQVVDMLEHRLDQIVIPDMVNLPDGSGVEISYTHEDEVRQVFPMVGVLPGEKTVYSPVMSTQADDIASQQAERLCEIDPSLDSDGAFQLLIARERARRQDGTVSVEFCHGYCAQVFAERGIVPLARTHARIYQQPLAAFAMQDIRGTIYQHAHPVVTTHEIVHLDDFSRLSVVDEQTSPLVEFSLMTELRAHHVSALGEEAVAQFGLDTSGMWHRSIYPNQPTVSSRVEALRRMHTSPLDPFQPLPSLYLALETAGMRDVY